MKLVVTFMPPVGTPMGPAHLNRGHDDAVSYQLKRVDGSEAAAQLVVTLPAGREVVYNWQHVLSLDVDAYGMVRPT